jgi:low temperature requirement protein LtrA
MRTEGRAGLRTTDPQAVTFVELFFDLVFVFAVTQVTVLIAHDLTISGIIRSLLLFWLIWWAWTQFTWTLNPADTTHPGVRLVTLIATGGAFVMATSVAHAFSDGAALFAVPYVFVRLLGLGLQVQVDLELPDADHAGVRRWVGLSLLGLVLVLVGAVADPALRPWIWALAIGADMVAAAIAGKATWDLNPAHISERHGLFVIIALGESLIVAGTEVAAEPRAIPLAGVAVAALVVACLLWWTYFGWLKEALEHGLAASRREDLGRMARDAFSLAHYPLVYGIIAFAVAIEEIVVHPDEPASMAVIVALGVGVALFVGFSSVAYWRLSGRFLLPRVAILAAMVPVLAVTAPLQPVWPLVGVAVTLFALVAYESVRAPTAD